MKEKVTEEIKVTITNLELREGEFEFNFKINRGLTERSGFYEGTHQFSKEDFHSLEMILMGWRAVDIVLRIYSEDILEAEDDDTFKKLTIN